MGSVVTFEIECLGFMVRVLEVSVWVSCFKVQG